MPLVWSGAFSVDTWRGGQLYLAPSAAALILGSAWSGTGVRSKLDNAVWLESRLAVGMARLLKRTPGPRPLADCAGAPRGGSWDPGWCIAHERAEGASSQGHTRKAAPSGGEVKGVFRSEHDSV